MMHRPMGNLLVHVSTSMGMGVGHTQRIDGQHVEVTRVTEMGVRLLSHIL
jgi:hypothetical protein